MPTARLLIEFETTQYSLDEVLDRLRSRPNLAPADSKPSASEAPTSPAAAAQTNVPAFTSGNVLDFLRSDDRYRLRTAEAVANHFGVDEGEASDLLGDLVDEGEVTTRRRRSDGVTLYEAA